MSDKKNKSNEEIKKQKWKNLKKRVVGMTVIKKDNKPFLLMLVKLPSKTTAQKGEGMPDILKKGVLLGLRGLANLSPNIAVFGLMITRKLVEDTAKFYTTLQKPENKKKSVIENIKTAFPEYNNSYQFWNDYITNPLLASVLLGAVSNISKTPILYDPASQKVKQVIKKGIGKLAKTLEMSPISLRTTTLQGSKYTKEGLSRIIASELKNI